MRRAMARPRVSARRVPTTATARSGGSAPSIHRRGGGRRSAARRGGYPATVGSMARITVASYNVHWGYDKRGEPFDVVEVCRHLDADLLVLQESWLPDGVKSEADRAATELGYTVTHATMGHGRVRSARGRKPRLCRASMAEGMLALTMLSRVPVIATTVIEMMNLPFDQAPRRVAVRADVEVEGKRFAYVGTHLSHLTHGSPMQLARLVAQLPPPGQPAALAGDMNMWGPV